MKLSIGISRYVEMHTERHLEIAPYNKFKTLMVSPAKMTALLREQVIARAYIDGLSEYIFKYALPRLLHSSSNRKRIYSQYDRCIKTLSERTHFCFHHYEKQIYFGKRLTRRGRCSILAYRFWRTLSIDEQKMRCQFIFVEQGTKTPDFFDVSLMFVDQGHDEIEDDEENSAENIELSTLRGQPRYLGFDPVKQLTIEDTVQACIDHILAEDPELNMGPEEAALRMKPFMDERLRNKINRNDKRLDTLLVKINPSSILKRLKVGSNVGYPKGSRDNPVRLSVPEFYLRYLDGLIHALLTPNWKQLIMAAPPATQKVVLKCAIHMCSPQLVSLQKFSDTGYLAPFSFSEHDFFHKVMTQARVSSALSENDIAHLLKSEHAAIKRLPGVSDNDVTMLLKLSEKRLLNLLNTRLDNLLTAKAQLDMLQGCFLSRMYLNAMDAGVRHARLRALVKAVYSYIADEPGQDAEPWMVRKFQRVTHDLFGNHERHLYAFFEKWNKHPKYASVINHVVDLLSSEMGGAQGNHVSAFQSLHANALPQLCGKEEILFSHSSVKKLNMKDLIHLAKQDPAAVEQCKQILQSLPPSVVPNEQLLVYASNTVGSRNFYTYLSMVRNERAKNEHRCSPLIPALRTAIQRDVHGMTLWVLPSDDLLGALGVATPGVCIPFGGEAHFQHQNQALANLILCDDHQIYLWGVLVRAQNKDAPTYILNNIQGALPSRHVKHKEEIRRQIRQLLREMGDVYSLDFNFNAIQLLDEEDGEYIDISKLELIVPHMRLDVLLSSAQNLDFEHPHREQFRWIVQKSEHPSYKKVS